MRCILLGVVGSEFLAGRGAIPKVGRLVKEGLPKVGGQSEGTGISTWCERENSKNLAPWNLTQSLLSHKTLPAKKDRDSRIGVRREDLFNGGILAIRGRQPKHPVAGPAHVERIIGFMGEEERCIRRRQGAELKQEFHAKDVSPKVPGTFHLLRCRPPFQSTRRDRDDSRAKRADRPVALKSTQAYAHVGFLTNGFEIRLAARIGRRRAKITED